MLLTTDEQAQATQYVADLRRIIDGAISTFRIESQSGNLQSAFEKACECLKKCSWKSWNTCCDRGLLRQLILQAQLYIRLQRAPTFHPLHELACRFKGNPSMIIAILGNFQPANFLFSKCNERTKVLQSTYMEAMKELLVANFNFEDESAVRTYAAAKDIDVEPSTCYLVDLMGTFNWFCKEFPALESACELVRLFV
jgi:hypothetical protein